MTKIMCFGSAGKDIFFPTAEGKVLETPEDVLSQKKVAFELGAKYAIKERHESLGGCAANMAVALAYLGISSVCVSNVGSDADGEWIKKELEKNGVMTDLLVAENARQSDMSAIIVNEDSADRVIFTNRSTSGEINIEIEKIKEAEWFFISDIHGRWEEQMEKIFEVAKEQNKKIAFNPREAGVHEDAPEVIEAIGLSEIVFLNKDEAMEIVTKMKNSGADPENVRDEKFLLEKLKSLEVKVAVITNGTNGAWATDGEKSFWAAAQEVKAVDSTGAGDSFAGAFLAAYSKGKSLGECLRWGIANSASVVEHYGATPGLMKEEDILEKIKNISVKDLAISDNISDEEIPKKATIGEGIVGGDASSEKDSDKPETLDRI